MKSKKLKKIKSYLMISRVILSFYTRPKPELPTLDKIHQEVLSILGIKKEHG